MSTVANVPGSYMSPHLLELLKAQIAEIRESEKSRAPERGRRSEKLAGMKRALGGDGIIGMLTVCTGATPSYRNVFVYTEAMRKRKCSTGSVEEAQD